MAKRRELRGIVLAALAHEPWPEGLARLDQYAPKGLTGPLYACLLERDPLLARRAAAAFGREAARIFEHRPEDARQLVRQFMWRLNEESGNIAWGIPETFGEVLAQQPALAEEFHRVLASYLFESDRKTGDTFIDHAALRRGVYAGLGRLAQARPEMVACAAGSLLGGLREKDPASRGVAAWALGLVLPRAGQEEGRIREALEALTGDAAPLEFYRDGYFREATVGGLAREALNGRG